MSELTVGELVTLGAARTPHRIAIKHRDGDGLTYRELDLRTTRLANALRAHGLLPGDRVGTWMEDCVDYVEIYIALAKAGLVVVPINSRFKVDEARYQVEDAGARALVWTAGLSEPVSRLHLDGVLRITSDSGSDADLRLDDLRAGGSNVPLAPPDRDALYIIGYTSGTTGMPKGAMLTHRSVLAISRMNAISYRLEVGSVAALTGSMAFVATVPAHIILHLYLGGTGVIMGPWDVERLLHVIGRERATFTYVPSPLLDDFAAAAASRPTAWMSLHSVLHSASRASAESLAGLCEVIGDRFVEGWGMTENSGGLMTATSRDDATSRNMQILGSVGRPTVEVSVDLIDGDFTSLPHDGKTVGELAFRSSALMTGYWNNRNATEAAVRDGWFRSGDIGTIDEMGYVHLTERRTDLIVSGGMNVYPSEVEACIMKLSGVRECAVVGLPHERWGETVVAVVVPEAGATLTAQMVIEHCRAHLAGYKKPTKVVFESALPRTTSLKVQRRVVRDRLLESSA